MIIGIGTDIIEINRIKEAVDKNERFLLKNFTDKEIDLFKERNFKAETISGNFAAKEAISKALGTGFRGFTLRDIEVLRDDLGKPMATISQKIKDQLSVDDYKIHISISHNKENAIAYSILEAI